jgi:protoheme IX farnesyltransferase
VASIPSVSNNSQRPAHCTKRICVKLRVEPVRAQGSLMSSDVTRTPTRAGARHGDGGLVAAIVAAIEREPVAPPASDPARTRARDRVSDYLALTKPRVVLMVSLTTLTGFYLGTRGAFDFPSAASLLGGTLLAAAGTMALNQFIERDLDARMIRTRMRPLPDGRMLPTQALVFGIVMTLAGCAGLWFAVNPLTAQITAAISVIYLFGYTPMKQVSPLCSYIGAAAGALPPVAGWAAARGVLGADPWALFGMMFLWQLPHSLAIAKLHQRDYARAGIRLLPSRDRSLGNQVVANSVALILMAVMPTVLGFAGAAYLVVSICLGLGLLVFSIRLAYVPEGAAARRLLMASVIYLPVIMLCMALDKI